MKIEVNEVSQFVLTHIYDPLVINTLYGDLLSVSARDHGFDLVLSRNKKAYRVDFDKGTIEEY